MIWLLAMLGAEQAVMPTAVARSDLNREMATFVSNIEPIPFACLRGFKQLKIPKLSIPIALDLDEAGKVSDATLETKGPDAALDACVVDWVRTAQFRPDSPRQGVYVAALINARLLPPPRKYQHVSSEGSASIRNWSKLALCKLTGLRGPPQRAACKATVLLIDGERAGIFALRNGVSAGTHKFMLACDVQDFSSFESVRQTSHSQTRTFAIQENALYELRPRWQGERCVVDMVDTNTGQPLQEHP